MFMKQLGEVETKRFGKIFINPISIKHKITNRTRTALKRVVLFLLK